MFDVSQYERFLKTGWLGRRFWYFLQLDSTNRYVQSLPGGRLRHGLLCLADYQTTGKGQYGKTWLSANSENLTFTIVLKPRPEASLQLLSMTAMLALQKTVISATGLQSVIKWPNDVLYQGKKIAGILTECRYNGQRLDRVSLGIGINVNQKDFPESIRDKAISLSMLCHGEVLQRELFLAMYLNRLEPSFARAEDGDTNLLRSINRSIAGYGKWVSIVVNGEKEETPVKILGINEFGYLMVLTANDNIKVFRQERIQILADSEHMITP